MQWWLVVGLGVLDLVVDYDFFVLHSVPAPPTSTALSPADKFDHCHCTVFILTKLELGCPVLLVLSQPLR